MRNYTKGTKLGSSKVISNTVYIVIWLRSKYFAEMNERFVFKNRRGKRREEKIFSYVDLSSMEINFLEIIDRAIKAIALFFYRSSGNN